ncbi:MAG: class I poly(R)-hydroxyalkanoic acid synthase [Hyphomonadaceae bacterium]|nr:class I poly(R)-hydroxyalkanoic acid synthase [Hyphomonadaceae bacterium]
MADGAPTATKTGAKSGARSSARKRRKPAGEALGTDAREATAPLREAGAAAAKPPAGPGPAPTTAPTSPPTLAEVLQDQSPESLQALSRNLAEAMTKANTAFSTAFQDQTQDGKSAMADPFQVNATLNTAWSSIAQQPETLRDAHGSLWKRYQDIWNDHARRIAEGFETAEAPAEASRDKRFRDPEWRTNPGYSLMRETYLATAKFITDLVEHAEGLDEQTKRKASFFVKQAVDAASPSNFLFTNPAALRATIQSRGENLIRGAAQLTEDLKRGGGVLAIKQTDLDAFTVGENIATTPGKVVFRNRLIELIQYTPTTKTTFEVPLLIFPPWINKFYIMDLQPKNSLIAWLVGQGHTVFVASWVNPDAELAQLGFEDYMREGVFAAVEVVQKAASVERMNTVGYCIGGTLLATTLAYMAKTGDRRIQSATFFAAQTDFKLAGELLVFADDPAINYVAERIDQHGGFLDAQAMADTFNALRANDLVWNYVVDNYYMGNKPPPFDLLYWNSDQTRMPKTLHLFYLQKMYRDNALAEGKLTIDGVKIDLGNVTIPIYMQSSKEDHIAPFPSVYRGAKLFGGPVNFLMAGSGHIAGVINHPDAKKYQHWVNAALPDTVEEWQAGAVERPGSWWPDWHAWLAGISGKQVPARDPAKGPYPVLADAPGTYVKIKSAG